MADNKLQVGIYKITSPSNKVYIGQSWNISRRFNQYSRMNGFKTQSILYNSLKKYGLKNHNFEIICELPSDITQMVLDNYEQIYINLYRDCNLILMNIREAGSRGKHSIETKRKMSISKIGNKVNVGRILSCETIEKMRKAKIGKSHPNMGKYKYTGKGRGGQRSILQYSLDGNFIRKFASINEASVELNIKRTSISECVNGRNKRAGKYIFKTNG